jgi:hypothetical protein
MTALKAATRAKLATISTATVATATLADFAAWGKAAKR